MAMQIKILLAAILFFSSFIQARERGLWGLYTNVEAVDGETSGVEIFIVHDGRPGTCSASVLIQVFEGWPQYPELLDCCRCTLDKVEFESTKLGRFEGHVSDGFLAGEFTSLKYKIKLKRGASIWQK